MGEAYAYMDQYEEGLTYLKLFRDISKTQENEVEVQRALTAIGWCHLEFGKYLERQWEEENKIDDLKKEKFQASDDYKIILIGRLSTNQSWHLENYCDTYIYFIKLKSREYIVYRKQQYCSFWTVDTLGKWYESEAVLGVGLNPYFVSVLITAAPVSIYYRYFAWNYGVKVFY